MTRGVALGDVQLFDEHSVGARDLLDRFEEEILEASFPPEQYVPSSYAGEGSPDGPLLIACGPDGGVLGGACGDVLPESNTLLLSYIAVREDFRGLGIGSLLMNAIRASWLQPERLAVLEIDDPRHHVARHDYGDPVARIRLYARFGVRALAVPFFQPSLGPDLPRSYHLVLGALAVPEQLRVGNGVAGGPVEHFVREYFFSCEGEAAFEDGELDWLLASYKVPEITLVPIDDLEQIPDPDPPSLAHR